MPKISDLPTDTAPDSADIIPFVDVTASRTESVTVANLAASTAFAGQYAPSVLDEDDFASNSATAPPSQQSTAAYVGANFEPLHLIERHVSVGGNITFSDIPADFEDLVLTLSGKSAIGSTGAEIKLNFNADTGANYDYAKSGWGSSGSASNGAADAALFISAGSVGSGGVTLHLDIPGYARTLATKGVSGHTLRLQAATTGVIVASIGGHWRSTAAITQIALVCNASGGFAAGTVASLYGRP